MRLERDDTDKTVRTDTTEFHGHWTLAVILGAS